MGTEFVSSCKSFNKGKQMLNITQARDEIVGKLRDFVNRYGGKCCLGSSGGIDSAVVISLACDAVGPENVWGFRMPSPNNDPQDEIDALELHKALGCNDVYLPLFDYRMVSTWVNSHVRKAVEGCTWKMDLLGPYQSVADENLQARMRAVMLMHFSNAYGGPLLLGTDNKVESYLGYFTLYGDSCGAIRPIGGLYKGEVYSVANLYPIPEGIRTSAPSAGLFKGQTDEEALLPYPILDKIVEAWSEHNISVWESFTDWTARDAAGNPLPMSFGQEDYDRITGMILKNKFKDEQCPPVIEVTR